MNHCQQRQAKVGINCACRFCREAEGKPIEGGYGFRTTAKEWQP